MSSLKQNLLRIFSKRDKKSPDLEDVIKQNEGLSTFNKLAVEQSFNDIEYSANILWNSFQSLGKITKIKKTKNYSEKLVGDPVMRRDIEGNIFPVEAAFEIERENSRYLVKFNTSINNLIVNVECTTEDIPTIQKILDEAKDDRITIEKRYESDESIAKLYKYLKETASHLKLLKESYLPSQMKLDNDVGLIPVKATFDFVLDGTKYWINFGSMSSEYSINIRCPSSKVDLINELLESFDSQKVKEGETEIKTLEGALSVKGYTWESVGGLAHVKQELQEHIEWPLLNPELFKHLNTTMPKGILLIGPPGNGKTTIAKILANETNSAFYSITPADINSMWVGESEKNVRKLFNQARNQVKKGKTALIFIDEIDGLYTNRDEMDKYTRKTFGQFCSELEGISDLEGVVVIGATNKYEDLDAALVRPGRFTKKIYIPNPDEIGRKEILDIYLAQKQISEDISITYLVEQTPNFSGAMLKEACDCAVFNAIRRYSTQNNVDIKDIKPAEFKNIIISKVDFEEYFKKMNNTVE
jgi:SpoVK/Ycf46/Vps4 family AAA+-type ATPase